MRRSRFLIAAAAAALAVPALAGTAAGAATRSADQQSTEGAAVSYVVLAQSGASAQSLAQQLHADGAIVTSVNQAIGMLTVTSRDTAFSTHTRGLASVAGVGRDRSIGYVPKVIGRDAV